MERGEADMAEREYLEIQRRSTKFSRTQSRTLKELVSQARAGNPAAIVRLRERYRITLPLVEETLRRPRTPRQRRKAKGDRTHARRA
jgi:hypothetical protein